MERIIFLNSMNQRLSETWVFVQPLLSHVDPAVTTYLYFMYKAEMPRLPQKDHSSTFNLASPSPQFQYRGLLSHVQIPNAETRVAIRQPPMNSRVNEERNLTCIGKLTSSKSW